MSGVACRWRCLALACTLHASACAGGSRDFEVTPIPAATASARPVAVAGPQVDAAAPGGDAGNGYERLVTRAHATFGLAESRGMEPDRLGQVLESIANGFEGCATLAQREGWLDRAALRIVVEVDAHGQVAGVSTRLDDPARGGKVALLCLVAPVKAQNFGEAAGSGRRGLALEVLFGPVRSAP